MTNRLIASTIAMNHYRNSNITTRAELITYLHDELELAPKTVLNSWIALSSFWTWASEEFSTPHIVRDPDQMLQASEGEKARFRQAMVGHGRFAGTHGSLAPHRPGAQQSCRRRASWTRQGSAPVRRRSGAQQSNGGRAG